MSTSLQVVVEQPAGHTFDAVAFRSPRGGAGRIGGNRTEWSIVVGDRIRRLRRDRGLTLVDLARLLRAGDPG